MTRLQTIEAESNAWIFATRPAPPRGIVGLRVGMLMRIADVAPHACAWGTHIALGSWTLAAVTTIALVALAAALAVALRPVALKGACAKPATVAYGEHVTRRAQVLDASALRLGFGRSGLTLIGHITAFDIRNTPGRSARRDGSPSIGVGLLELQLLPQCIDAVDVAATRLVPCEITTVLLVPQLLRVGLSHTHQPQ